MRHLGYWVQFSVFLMTLASATATDAAPMRITSANEIVIYFDLPRPPTAGTDVLSLIFFDNAPQYDTTSQPPDVASLYSGVALLGTASVFNANLYPLVWETPSSTFRQLAINQVNARIDFSSILNGSIEGSIRYRAGAKTSFLLDPQAIGQTNAPYQPLLFLGISQPDGFMSVDQAPPVIRRVVIDGTQVYPTTGSPSQAVSRSTVIFTDQGLSSTSPAESITLTNSGTTNLQVGTLTLVGASPGDFLIPGDGCSGAIIPPGTSCSFSAAFNPTAAGRRTASISIPSNASNSPSTVTLLGNYDYVASWQWPIQGSDNRGLITQDFSEYQSVVKSDGSLTNHHTGLDIGVPVGTPVVASGYGTIVLLQRSRAGDSTCSKPGTLQESGNCGDHGLGNAVVLQHRTGSPDTNETINATAFVYSQYQHLRQHPQQSAFATALEAKIAKAIEEKKCDPENASGVILCKRLDNRDYPVIVEAGEMLGFSGGSGNGVPDAYAPHLHFETKRFGTLAFYRESNGRFEYGYTFDLPDSPLLVQERRYIDPSILLDGAGTAGQRKVVKVTTSTNRRIGPRTDYSSHPPLESPALSAVGELFIATREAPATKGCSLGWYQIVRTNRDMSLPRQPGAYFDDLSEGLNPDSWVCKGDDSTGESVSLFRSGDVNNDGIVDQKDVCRVRAAVSAHRVTGANDVLDLNADGRVTKEDANIEERLCSPNCVLSQCP